MLKVYDSEESVHEKERLLLGIKDLKDKIKGD
jgi:hypothetical protein